MSIEITGLTHVYSAGTPFETAAIRDISLSIPDGAFAGIIGHTGSGKSTLIQHLNALVRPTSGTILINGLCLTEEKPDLKAIRRTVGLVFQYPEYQLFEETVKKDIAFGPSNLGLSVEETEARVMDACALCGVQDSWLEKSPFELSGGQKRRVAIAGVIAMNPKVLVLDEPAAGLDPAGREDMLAMVERVHARGTTVIMVSHSMDDVGCFCDRLFVMNHGSLAMTGTPAEVFMRAEELRAIGLDIPEEARLAEKLRAAGWKIPMGLYRREDIRDAIISQLKERGA